MSGGEKFLLASTVILGTLMGLSAYWQLRRDTGWVPKDNAPLYLPLPSLSYFFLVGLGIPSLLILGLFCGLLEQLFLLLGINLIVVSAYYILVLALRPLLRKWLRPASFALLWSAPCVSLLFGTRIIMLEIPPLWNIRLPVSCPSEDLIRWMVVLWLIVFLGIMMWSLVSHLHFRRQILKTASLVEEEWVQQAYARQAEIIRFRRKIRIYRSSGVQTPLSIGLRKETTCIVLPEREYSAEELTLIFRHELIHICREDSLQKLFMTFCTALLWFNPFMWLAMKHCAEDLELSCDDAVLYGYEQGVRRRYAGLLLQTAADQRGFTTCLAASPGSLKYRLKEAVKPQKRFAGSVLVGVLSCLLIVGSTCVGVSFLPQTERIFQKNDRESWVVSDVIVTDGEKDPYTKYYDADALYDYVASLKLSRCTKIVDPVREYRHVQLLFHSGNQTVIVQIGGKLVRVYKMTFHNGERTHNEEFYYTMDEELDMEYILSCLHG